MVLYITSEPGNTCYQGTKRASRAKRTARAMRRARRMPKSRPLTIEN